MSSSSHFPSAPDHVFKTPHLMGRAGFCLFTLVATSPITDTHLLKACCTASLTVMKEHLRCVCFSWVQDPHGVSLEKLLAGLKNWVFQLLLLSRSVVSDSV